MSTSVTVVTPVVTGTGLHTLDTQEVIVTTVVVMSVVVEGNGQ